MHNDNTRLMALLFAIMALASGFVASIVIFGRIDANSTPLITTVLGFVSLVVVTLLNLLTVRRTTKQLDEVDKKVNRVLNGDMESKVRRIMIDTLRRHLDRDEDNETVTKRDKG